MSQLDKETIQQLSRLCRIDCTEEEQESILKDLQKILHYMAQLEEIDTENTPPCNSVLENSANVMRDDIVQNPLNRDLFLANTPLQIGGMIRVPPVIK